MIKKCIGARCNSIYQDQKYGKNMRIFNKKMDNTYKCTICESITGNKTIKNIQKD